MRGDRAVFSGLDFALDAGEVLLLTGPNGSGKSSLLRMMCGLLPPVSGAIEWDGSNISEDRESHAARLHYVGHLDGVKLALTAAENLRFWAALRPGSTEIGRALETFGIAALADLPARFLSADSAGRSQPRGLRARATGAPALAVLDEPTPRWAPDAGRRPAPSTRRSGKHCAGGASCVGLDQLRPSNMFPMR